MRGRLGGKLWWTLNLTFCMCVNEPLGAYGVELWNNIVKGWGKFEVISYLR